MKRAAFYLIIIAATAIGTVLGVLKWTPCRPWYGAPSSTV